MENNQEKSKEQKQDHFPSCTSLACRVYQRKRSLKEKLKDHPFEASAIGDLAFLLLIFFIVTSSFILRQGIFLSLPSENAGTVKIEPNMLINLYPREKDFLVDKKRYTREMLLEYLKKKKKEKPGIIVLIFMKPEIKYHRLVDTLSAAKESGIKQVSVKNI